MYALKARDKLHKLEKDAGKEKQKEALRRARDQDAYHRGREAPHDSQAAPCRPTAARRDAKYIGTFSVQFGAAWKKDIAKCVKHHLGKLNTKHPTNYIPVSMLVSMDGVKVIAVDSQQLIMAHALQRILYVTADTKKSIFAMVSRNPQTGAEGIYCHVFLLPSKEKAKDVSELVGKAFKAVFTKQSLKRDKKKKEKISSTPTAPSLGQHDEPSRPWTVVREDPGIRGGVQAPAVGEGGRQQLRDVGRQGASQNVQRSTSPFQEPQQASQAEQLEAEILALHSKIHELESRLAHLGGHEDFAVELTVQLSSYQQELEDKSRKLATVQHKSQSSLSPPPPSYTGTGSSASRMPDIDSLSLEDAQWFQAGLPREIAMEILSHQGEGAFIVRESASNPGCYALSLKTPSGKIVHYLIEQGSTGMHFQGSTQAFPSLVSLILHHSQHQDFLPIQLTLGESNPTFLDTDTHGDGGSPDPVGEDLDFQSSLEYRLIDM